MPFDVNDPLGLKSKSPDYSKVLRADAPGEFDVSDPLGLKRAKSKTQTKPTILGKSPVSDTPVKVRINGGDTRTLVDNKRVGKLQSRAKQLEQELRDIESSGMFDSTNKRQELANYYLQLQKMQGQPQQIGGIPPVPAGSPKPPVATGITSLLPKADPFDKLQFDYQAFKTMLDRGDNIVATRDGRSIPRNVAERQVSKFTGQPGPFQGAPNLAQRENKVNEAGLAPNQNAFTTSNPNQKRFSTANQYIGEIASNLSQVYEKATGLSADDAPYAHEALNFLGGLVTTPMQVAKGAAYGVQHPVQALKNTPELLGQAAQSVNVFDPNISGSERFGRFLNIAFTVGGGAHFREFIKRSIADGSIYRLGAKLGLNEAAATRDAIDFFKKQQEIHGANLDTSNRLGQLDLNQSKRNIDHPVTPPPVVPKRRFSKKPEGNIVVPKPIHTETATLSDPFGLGIPVSHELEGIHPTPEFDNRNAPTSTPDPEDINHANEQILDHAVRIGLKPEAADYVELAASDMGGHIHEIYSQHQLEAVAKSKLSGRRQIKALDWLAANEIHDPELIARGVKLFEENPVRFTPSGGRETDGHFRRANTSPENASTRGDNGSFGGLDRIIDDQLKLNKLKAASDASDPSRREVNNSPEPKPKQPKTPRERKPKAPKVEPDPAVTDPVETLHDDGEKPENSPKVNTVETDPSEVADVEAASKRERKGKAGLTPSQIGYLSRKLKDAHEGLPPNVNAIQGSDPNSNIHGFTKPDGTPSTGVAIKIPGDGEFTVHSQAQAKALNEAVGGTPFEGAPPTHPKEFYGNSERYIHGEYQGQPVSGTPEIMFLGEHEAHGVVKAHETGKTSQHIDSVFNNAKGDKTNIAKPLYTDAGKKFLWLKGKNGEIAQVRRPLADMIYKRGYEILAPSDVKQPLRIIDPKTGETRGVVVQRGLDIVPDQSVPYKQPKAKIEKPNASMVVRERANEAKPKGTKKTPTTPAPTPPAPTHTPPVTPKEAHVLSQAVTSIKKTFMPMSLGKGAKSMGLRLREHFGNIAATQAKDAYALKQAHDYFAKRSPRDNHEFIKRMEAGDPQGSPELDKFAREIRKILDTKRAEVQGLGKGLLQHYYANYFPHLWEKPGMVSEWIRSQKRPLEGGKSALKKRSMSTIEEGLSKGFKPISDNPVDMVLAHAHQMDMFVNAQRLLQEMKDTGQVTYLRVGAPMPDGYAKLDDKLFQVNHNGIMLIHEAYDEKMMGQLNQLARDLGVRHDRQVSLKGHPDAWGLESKAGVQTKFGGPETVLSHELGHVIDRKHGLRRALFQGPERDITLAEMKKLAALRYEGSTPSNSYKRYTEKQQEMVANLVHAYIHAPHLLEKIAPVTTKLFDKFIDSKPQLKSLRDIKPSLVLGTNSAEIRAPGVHTLGHYIAPTDVAAVMNNALAKGLRHMFGIKQYMALNNSINQLNLGFSGFHYVTTGFNSMISEMALGLEEMSKGTKMNPVKVAKHAVMGINPLTPVRDFKTGGEITKAFLNGIGDPKMRTIIDGVIKGGGRFQQPDIYTNEAIKRFQTALGRKDIWGTAKSAPFAATEYAGRHLMQQVVPRVKLGAFSQLLQADLDRLGGKTLTDEEFRAMAAKAWDSIDNRFGQMVYDNLFWHPVVKDLAMASTRSVGWTLGTTRELGGGALDVPGNILRLRKSPSGEIEPSHRLAYTAALPITVGLYGAMTQYLLTGKVPTRSRDLYFPLTGRKNADGTDERLSLPSYMKDYWGYTNDLVGTLKSKASPLASDLWSVITGTDYFGNKIVAEDDPWYKKGESLLKFYGKSALPFTASNIVNQYNDTGKVNYLALAGLNKASAAISKTRAIELAQHYAFEQVPKGNRTTEQANRQQQLSQVVGMIRNGEKEDALKKLRDLKVTNTEAKYVFSHSQGDVLPKMLKSLSIDQALNVYDVATRQEKRMIAGDIAKKLINATQNNKKNYSPEDFQNFIRRLKAGLPITR